MTSDIIITQEETQPIIQQQKLDDSLQVYVQMLAEQRPFALDIRTDERHIVSRLATQWPQDPAWEKQAHQLRQCIDDIVQSIPAIKTVPDIVLRVSAAGSPLVPTSIPSPHGFSALVTIDADDGMMYHCVLPGMETLPSLDAMQIPAGIMAIGQPVPPLVSQFSDNRSSALGAGTNMYTERARDKIVPENNLG